MGTRTDRRLGGWEKNIGNDKCGRRWGVFYRRKRNGDRKNSRDKENYSYSAEKRLVLSVKYGIVLLS